MTNFVDKKKEGGHTTVSLAEDVILFHANHTEVHTFHFYLYSLQSEQVLVAMIPGFMFHGLSRAGFCSVPFRLREIGMMSRDIYTAAPRRRQN